MDKFSIGGNDVAMMKNHEMIQGSGEDVEAQVGKHRKAQRRLKAGLA